MNQRPKDLCFLLANFRNFQLEEEGSKRWPAVTRLAISHKNSIVNSLLSYLGHSVNKQS